LATGLGNGVKREHAGIRYQRSKLKEARWSRVCRYTRGMKKQFGEEETLKLIDDLQVLLAETVASIVGKKTTGEVSYLRWGASRICKIVEGYSELRRRQMIHASKILIRPVMETTAAVVAAFRRTGFLFQKSYCEYEEDKTLLVEFRNVMETAKEQTGSVEQKLEELELSWEQSKSCWSHFQPDVPQKCEKLSFPGILHVAGLNGWYAQYRLYCQFTHGTMRAASGNFDEMTDPADNLIIAHFTLIILDHLKKYAPVEMVDLAPFWHRANLLRNGAYQIT